jgi:methylmalonyl-CoA/ethylmalonyl-CoA epimerase
MNITHIEHIGIAVKNLEESIKFYEEILALKCYEIEEVKDQNVRTAFFLVGQTKVELLESTDSEGPISKFIQKRGEGIHHIAYAVSDLTQSLDELKQKGIQLIDSEPRPGAERMNIAFIHPKAAGGVLTELCEDGEI